MSDTTIEELISAVASSKQNWFDTSIDVKLKHLKSIETSFYNNIGIFENVSKNKRSKQIDASLYPPSSSSDDFLTLTSIFLSPAVFSSWLFNLRSTLEREANQTPMSFDARTTFKDETRKFIKVAPYGILQKLALPNTSVELIVKNDLKQDEADTKLKSGVSLVLGAGNYDAPIDVLHSMFILNNVCIYKLSPFSVEYYDVLRSVFKTLIDDGFLVILKHEEAPDLTQDGRVDRIVLTGSLNTASYLMWGSKTPPPRDSPQKELTTKKKLFECGSCTPWIICPGEWSMKELKAHAKHVAFAMALNAGHICAHPQLIVTCKNWPQRKLFNELLIKNLKEVPLISWFYPGVEERMNEITSALESKGGAREFFRFPLQSNTTAQEVIYASNTDASYFNKNETFCAASGEAALDTEATTASFLPAAVEYVNDECYGNLVCGISVKTTTKEEEDALNEGICALKYGAITVNLLPTFAFIYPQSVWGAYPEFDKYDIQSGCGFLGNCEKLPNVEKAVVRSTFMNPLLTLLGLPSPYISRISKVIRHYMFLVHACSGWSSIFTFGYRLLRIGSVAVFNI